LPTRVKQVIEVECDILLYFIRAFNVYSLRFVTNHFIINYKYFLCTDELATLHSVRSLR